MGASDPFLMNWLLIPFAVRLLTAPERKWNTKSPLIGNLLSILLICFISYAQHPGFINHYHVLNVKTFASPEEIRSAYRRLSLKYHPDKNPAGTTFSEFEKITLAHDVLTNSRKRASYHRFGDSEARQDLSSANLLLASLCSYLLNCAASIFIGVLCHCGSERKVNREICITINAIILCFEIILRFDPQSEFFLYYVPFIGSMLPFEKLKAASTLSTTLFFCSAMLGRPQSRIKKRDVYALIYSKMANQLKMQRWLSDLFKHNHIEYSFKQEEYSYMKQFEDSLNNLTEELTQKTYLSTFRSSLPTIISLTFMALYYMKA